MCISQGTVLYSSCLWQWGCHTVYVYWIHTVDVMRQSKKKRHKQCDLALGFYWTSMQILRKLGWVAWWNHSLSHPGDESSLCPWRAHYPAIRHFTAASFIRPVVTGSQCLCSSNSQNGMQFKAFKLFVSGIFYLIVWTSVNCSNWDCGKENHMKE